MQQRLIIALHYPCEKLKNWLVMFFKMAAKFGDSTFKKKTDNKIS